MQWLADIQRGNDFLTNALLHEGVVAISLTDFPLAFGYSYRLSEEFSIGWSEPFGHLPGARFEIASDVTFTHPTGNTLLTYW